MIVEHCDFGEKYGLKFNTSCTQFWINAWNILWYFWEVIHIFFILDRNIDQIILMPNYPGILIRLFVDLKCKSFYCHYNGSAWMNYHNIIDVFWYTARSGIIYVRLHWGYVRTDCICWELNEHRDDNLCSLSKCFMWQPLCTALSL